MTAVTVNCGLARPRRGHNSLTHCSVVVMTMNMRGCFSDVTIGDLECYIRIVKMLICAAVELACRQTPNSCSACCVRLFCLWLVGRACNAESVRWTVGVYSMSRRSCVDKILVSHVSSHSLPIGEYRISIVCVPNKGGPGLEWWDSYTFSADLWNCNLVIWTCLNMAWWACFRVLSLGYFAADLFADVFLLLHVVYSPYVSSAVIYDPLLLPLIDSRHRVYCKSLHCRPCWRIDPFCCGSVLLQCSLLEGSLLPLLKIKYVVCRSLALRLLRLCAADL